MSEYRSLAQVDADALSAGSPSVGVLSPEIGQHDYAAKTSIVAHNNGIDQTTEGRGGDAPIGLGVESLFRSVSDSSQSYDVVENDDYEEVQATPRRQKTQMDLARTSTSGTPTEPAFAEEQPMRTASINRHLPLHHPTPDLGSLQGAYLKNVESLEESAERLSIASSLDAEMQRMKQEQRRPDRRPSDRYRGRPSSRSASQHQDSTTSLSNSIIEVNNAARTGGYSPQAYITSPVGSIRSTPWSPPASRKSSRRSVRGASGLQDQSHALQVENDVATPLEEERETENRVPTPFEALYDEAAASALADPDQSAKEDKPHTRPSRYASQRHSDHFADFDGVHFDNEVNSALSPNSRLSRQISINRPPLARDSRAFREAQPGEKMIYYPAPVPVVLNLPQRLSKFNVSEHEKRRLKALSGIPEEMRKSAPWLANENSPRHSRQSSAAQMPPQLRASAFFDSAGLSPNLELKNGSAQDTLNSILDAAAYAPVSAFTDHPIIGHLGKEVYGASPTKRKSMQPGMVKKRNSLSNLLKRQFSSDALSQARGSRLVSRESMALAAEDGVSGDELDRADARAMAPDEDEVDEDNIRNNNEDQEDASTEGEHLLGFSGAPTTLLAELQVRKAQQKMRNKTAADAFPNGMHSTLLEMDAVTQLQQKARKTKHVTLAWEDQDVHEQDNFDDEDVPLGVLFPEKNRQTHVNLNRPIGLLERRELDDNELLRQRRARLRGEPVQLRPAAELPLPVEQAYEEDPADDNETLAQRLKRLKAERQATSGTGFADEVASELGLNLSGRAPSASNTPDPEETLGQRRKRLQEEASKKPALTQRRSMADILQAHPTGGRQVSATSKLSGGSGVFNNGGLGDSYADWRGQPLRAPVPETKFAPYGYLPGNQNMYMNPGQNMYMSPGYMPQAGIYGPGFGHGYGMPQQMQMGGYPYGYGMNMNMHMGMNMATGIPGYMQDPFMEPSMDPNQKAMIDQWRQSVMQ